MRFWNNFWIYGTPPHWGFTMIRMHLQNVEFIMRLFICLYLFLIARYVPMKQILGRPNRALKIRGHFGSLFRISVRCLRTLPSLTAFNNPNPQIFQYLSQRLFFRASIRATGLCQTPPPPTWFSDKFWQICDKFQSPWPEPWETIVRTNLGLIFECRKGSKRSQFDVSFWNSNLFGQFRSAEVAP